MRVPRTLQDEWRREAKWLADLPQLAAECAAQWGLDLEEALDTPHSLVVPAGDVVLKLNAPSHLEADHEADALERWAGDGAVQLVARDDDRRALLIERCRPGTHLMDAGIDEAAVVAGLLPRLWGEPREPHPFRLLADESDRWAEAVRERYELGGRPFERRLIDFAVDVFRTVERGAGSLVNQDLHSANVLRATREPWLVIDPKPLVGEREANCVGLLRNAALQGAAEVRRWLGILGQLGLDQARMQGWGVAHALAWGWDHAGRWSPRAIAAARAIFAA